VESADSGAKKVFLVVESADSRAAKTFLVVESADSRAKKRFLVVESADVSFFDLPAGWPGRLRRKLC